MARNHDLTTGALFGHFRMLAVPAAIGMVFSTLYNVVDVFYAGMISTDAQAGMSIAFQAFFLFITVGFGIGSAMTALVGNAKGRKADQEGSDIAAQGISFALIGTIVLMCIAHWLGPKLIGIISEPGDYRDAALLYFQVLLLAMPGFILTFSLNGMLQAQGDTVSMQRALIAAFFANLILNPLFVFGIPTIWDGMGFNGIALATVISQSGVMAFVAYQVRSSGQLTGKTFADYLPNLTIYKQIIALAMPSAFTMLVMIFAGFVVNYYMKTFGTSAVAAHGVALRVEQLFLLPVFGLTGALLPIAAQNYGAGNHDRVREALFTCWKLGWIFTAFASPTLIFAAPTLLRVFTDDPEVLEIGVAYLRVDGLIFPIYMMLFSINAFLQALKKPTWTFWISVYRQGFGIAFFSWVFIYGFGFGVVGVWYGIAVSVITGFLLSLLILAHVAKPLIGPVFARNPATDQI